MDINKVWEKIEASGFLDEAGGDESAIAIFRSLVGLWPQMLADIVNEPVTVINIKKTLTRMMVIMDSPIGDAFLSMGGDDKKVNALMLGIIKDLDQQLAEMPEDGDATSVSDMFEALCLEGPDAENVLKAKTIGELVEAYPLIYFRAKGYY